MFIALSFTLPQLLWERNVVGDFTLLKELKMYRVCKVHKYLTPDFAQIIGRVGAAPESSITSSSS
jgi:hypothetical protein